MSLSRLGLGPVGGVCRGVAWREEEHYGAKGTSRGVNREVNRGLELGLRVVAGELAGGLG